MAEESGTEIVVVGNGDIGNGFVVSIKGSCKAMAYAVNVIKIANRGVVVPVRVSSDS